jgi:hypothetical protein
LIRPTALGWLLAVAGFSVLLGTVAESSTKDITGSKGVAQAIGGSADRAHPSRPISA